MAKVKIDTAYVSIELDDASADTAVLGPRALALYREATGIDSTLPNGPAGGLNAERRGTSNLGFGTWHRQATAPEATQ
jgi:hypothetical protein